MSEQQMHEMATEYLDKSLDTLEDEERRVLARISARKPISQDAAEVADETLTFGGRLADRVAQVGGSWGFIIAFGVVLVSWMLLNTDILSHWGLVFDPYPYIFLNLMLSMLAAVQAPVILMSQNRQAAKDRITAGLDFEVNLRAELEIIRLHAKIDNAIAVKLDALLDQQKVLADRLNEIIR